MDERINALPVESIVASFQKKIAKVTVIIIVAYRCCQLNIECYQ
jgi:hypothetical protein